MLNPENHLKNATRVMRLVGWLCFAGLPLFALLYPPGVLWGEVHPDLDPPVGKQGRLGQASTRVRQAQRSFEGMALRKDPALDVDRGLEVV